MSQSGTLFLGMDVHQDTIAAGAAPVYAGDVTDGGVGSGALLGCFIAMATISFSTPVALQSRSMSH
jgi:hypothetical protein